VDLSIFFAGTGGSTPSARRGMPALLLRRGGERILFDCGEGTQRQLVRSVGLVDLDAIFITHFHADHWLGLPGLLKTYALRERSEALSIYGPIGLRKLMDAVRFIYGRLPYPLELCELEPMAAQQRDGYTVTAVPVEHRNAAALGYAIVEDSRPGTFDPDAALALGVRPGPDFGRLQRGEVVGDVHPEQVMGPPRLGRKVVISGDTSPCQALAIAAHQADLLIHEATFLEEDAQRARETEHSTARQAALLADQAQVRMLALVHISGRYPPRLLREEARLHFPGALTPRDFDLIEVPFPERGEPRIISFDRLSNGQSRAPEEQKAANGATAQTAAD
jgi:ribonuclease Z